MQDQGVRLPVGRDPVREGAVVVSLRHVEVVPRIARPVAVLGLQAHGAAVAHLDGEGIDAVVGGGVVLDVLADEVDALFTAVVVGEHDVVGHAAGQDDGAAVEVAHQAVAVAVGAHVVAIVAFADAGGHARARSTGPPATTGRRGGRRGRWSAWDT